MFPSLRVLRNFAAACALFAFTATAAVGQQCTTEYRVDTGGNDYGQSWQPTPEAATSNFCQVFAGVNTCTWRVAPLGQSWGCWPEVGTPGGTNAWGQPNALCLVKNGQTFSAGPLGVNTRCTAADRIAFTFGASSTKALIAGPALVQTVTVTRNGSPLAGKAVNISIAGAGAAGATGGVTDGNGNFTFTYVPPGRRTVDQLTANCTNCVNTAQKSITVESCDVCEPAVGNPIQPATGEKIQAETDWQDHSPHPLTFTRHYRSFDNVDARMGPRWAHNFAAFFVRADAEAVVRLGEGDKVLFRYDPAASRWVADNRRDALLVTTGGSTYTRASDESRWLFDGAGRLLSITARNGWTYAMAYDGLGRLASVTNAFGRSIAFQYGAAGLLLGATFPDGGTVSYSYGATGTLASVRFADGTARSYTYEDARWPSALTGIVDEGGARYATFAYDAAGRAVGTQHAGAAAYDIGYAAASPSTGSLVAGTTIDSSIFRASAQVNTPLGSQQTISWIGGDGQIRKVGASNAFDGQGFASRSLDDAQLPAMETDFAGVQTTFTWDRTRQLKTSTTEAAGIAESRTTQTQWHAIFRLPVLVTKPGVTTAYQYDNAGNMLSQTVTDTTTGEVRTWRWTYTTSGLVESMSDARGATWRYGYDAQGNRVSVTDPMGQVSQYAFDAAGRVTSQKEPGGLETTFAYDARGRVTSQSRGGEATAFAYTPTGLLASVTMPDGYRVAYAYDTAQRLVSTTDNRGAGVQYTLDAMGNAVAEQLMDGGGNMAIATTRVVDALNRITAVRNSQGQAATFGYDANGERISETNALQQTTQQSLDALRRVTATTFADNARSTQAWDERDAMTRFTDPKGVATRFETNAFGDVLRESSADIGSLAYTRDANGEVSSVQDALGQVTTIERDALGRPARIRYADGKEVSLQYDAAGFVSRMEDRSGSTTYTRDAHGRVLAKTQSIAGNSLQLDVAYGYSNGQLASITYPSGLKVLYARDATGRITHVDVQAPPRLGRTSAPAPFVTGLAFTAFGQPKAWNWSSGDTAARTFDTDGRMTGNEFAGYTWDAGDRITGITQQLWTQSAASASPFRTPITWTAGYDKRSRLTEFSRAGAQERFTYDANGNRLTAFELTSSESDLEGNFGASGFTRTATQNLSVAAGSNRLEGFTQTLVTTNSAGGVSTNSTQATYTIDANGAMTGDGVRTFEYDAAARLSSTKIAKDGDLAEVAYLHNGRGERVFKSQPHADDDGSGPDRLGAIFIRWLKRNMGWVVPKSKRHGKHAADAASLGIGYVYDEASHLLGEYDNGIASSQGPTDYIWLPTESGDAILVGMYRNGRLYSIHTDHLGTPRLVTDDRNTPVWQWPYSAFGDNPPTGVLQAAIDKSGKTTLKATAPAQVLNVRFPGQYFDSESGLAYNGWRSYMPKGGRYSQPDLIGLAGGDNRFGYAEGDPLRLSDPKGLATYICRRPLGGSPGSYAPPVLNHTYVCVGAGPNMTCGSTTASSGGVLANIFGGSPGKPTSSLSDYFRSDACDKDLDDNQCVETCIANELKNSPRPWYGVGPAGDDCQEYTERVIKMCKQRCVRR